MWIETIEVSPSDEWPFFRELAKDEDVMIVRNAYWTMRSFYDRTGHEKDELDYNTCWRMRPLYTIINDNTDPGIIDRTIISIKFDNRVCLVRLHEGNKGA